MVGPKPKLKAGPAALPTLRRMLRNGVHFEQAWAHPVCTPTRASLWTGKQPWRTSLGYPLGGDLLPTDKNLVSLPQALAAASAGYRCAMFGKWDLGGVRDPSDPAKDQNPVKTWGWNHFAGIYRGGLRADGVRDYMFADQGRVSWERLNGSGGNPTPEALAKRKAAAAALKNRYELDFLKNNPDLRYYIWEKDVVDSGGRTAAKRQSPTERQFLYATEDQVEDAKAWLTQNRDAGPWCIALNLITPHDPLHVPPPDTFGETTIKDPTKPTVQEMVVAMLESMDHYLGKLIEALGDQLANTVIIFAGDNGTQDVDIDTNQGIDATRNDDKGTDGIGGLHVPMIVADGGVMAGKQPCYLVDPRRSIAAPVHVIDIYDTVLDLAGATSKPDNDSQSLAPHLKKGAGKKRQHNFSQMFAPWLQRLGTKQYECPGISASASDGGFKLTCRALRKPFEGEEDRLYLVDPSGEPSATPHFEYLLSKLERAPAIRGAFVEKKIDALVRNADGTSFSITRAGRAAEILELHGVLAKQRLDATGRTFPPIAVTSVDPTGTTWSVGAIDDDGKVSTPHATPWEFGAGTMKAQSYWTGTYNWPPGRARSIACRNSTDGKTFSKFETHFVTPTRFVSTKDGALHRFGKKLSGELGPVGASTPAAKAFDPSGTQWSVGEMNDDGVVSPPHPTPWEFGAGTVKAASSWAGTYESIPGQAPSIRCTITVPGEAPDSFEVHFLTATRFVCTRKGSLFRFGKKL